MRSFRSVHNLLAVSANLKEAAINTEQTLDTAMLVDESSIINLERRRQQNEDEITGKEEPDLIYDLGGLARGPFSPVRGQPQHFAFIMAYALGAVSTAAAGAGYEHTITPIENDEDLSRSLASFTLAQRLGKTVAKQRFASMFVDSFTGTFAKDDWCKIAAQLVGTGKITTNIVEETVSALNDAESLTLAANAVEGATAAARLDNVQRIRVDLDGDGTWTEVEYSAVSDATPAVITITDPGGDGLESVDYKILYIPEESGWMTFPSRVLETPLRVAEMTFKLGGAWDGSAFQGGRELAAELNSVEWNFANNLAVEFVAGAGDVYASRAFRPNRTQTLRLNREMRDYIVQNYMDQNEYIGGYILASGAAIDESHDYQVELIFPRLGILTAPISVDGKRIAEAGDLTVLEDDTYGSVIAKVKNVQETYAAAS